LQSFDLLVNQTYFYFKIRLQLGGNHLVYCNDRLVGIVLMACIIREGNFRRRQTRFSATCYVFSISIASSIT